MFCLGGFGVLFCFLTKAVNGRAGCNTSVILLWGDCMRRKISPKFSLNSWKVMLVSVLSIPDMTGVGEGAQEETPS